MNCEQTKSEQQKNVDVRKNVKPLAEVYPNANIKEIISTHNLQMIETYDIEDEKALNTIHHPFSHTYIDVIFNDEVTSSNAMAVEPQLRQELSNAIRTPLSLYGQETTGYKKLIYHVDHEI